MNQKAPALLCYPDWDVGPFPLGWKALQFCAQTSPWQLGARQLVSTNKALLKHSRPQSFGKRKKVCPVRVMLLVLLTVIFSEY